MNLVRTFYRLQKESSHNPHLSQGENARFQYFTLFIIFAIPLMLFFGVTNFLQGNTWVSYFTSISASALALGWLFIRFIGKSILIFRINITLYIALLTYLLILGGESGSKILWFYTFPFSAFFLFGKREGTFWNMITIILVTSLLFSPKELVSIYPYHPAFRARFLLSYTIVIAITFWLAYLRDSYLIQLKVHNQTLKDEITERRRIEKEREELITQIQATSQAKSEFLANMSHEIRTPLNGIIGMSSILLDTKLDEQQLHYVTTLNRSGDFLLAIINDILDVSKIEAGKFKLNPAPFSLRELLDTIADLATRKVYTVTVTLSLWADPEVPDNLIGDADRLRQILLNLTSNALKFTEDGSVTIRVSIQEQQEDRLTLLFLVTDTGIGISPDDQSRLFQSFSQIDTPTTREYCGTGLGLTISKQLCECMGGEIGVNSRLGEGSEFWFSARLQLDLQREPSMEPELHRQSALVMTGNRFMGAMLVNQLDHWGATARLIDEPIIDTAHTDIVVVDMTSCNLSNKFIIPWLEELASKSEQNLIILEEEELLELLPPTVTDRATLLHTPLQFGELLACLLPDNRHRPAAAWEKNWQSLPRLQFEPSDKKLLLAEDNLINREVLTAILAKVGIQRVDSVDNGLAVLEALNREHYDAILMDLSMPKMDGLTATARIRQDSYTANSSDIPIIALTAHAISGDREHCLAAGMNDYLTKPIHPAMLLQKLNAWLAPSPNQAVPAAPTASTTDTSAGKSSPPSPEAAQQADSLSHFNPQALVARTMGDAELSREILKMYLAETPAQLELLTRQLRDGKREALRRLAHKLKGAAANLALEQMCELCKELEVASTEATATTEATEQRAASLIKAIRQEFHEVRKHILRFLD